MILFSFAVCMVLLLILFLIFRDKTGCRYVPNNNQFSVPVQKRHLIYLCFVGESYFDIAKLLLLSIDRFVKRDDVDVLIRTDMQTSGIVANWLQSWNRNNRNIIYHLQRSTKPMYMHRFEITSLYANYDKILYLDTDILISNGNINQLFNEPLDTGVVYVVKEGTDFNRHEWSHKHYSEEQMSHLRNNGIYPFNNGQFLFRYTKEMAEHFDNVMFMIESQPHNSFIDQQCMNQYLTIVC